LGPSVKSVYLVPCGHVFAEEAIRQLKGDKCLQVSCLVFQNIYIRYEVSNMVIVQRVLHRRQHHSHSPHERSR
jgi:hypothetical protein